jgi:hypothetical protein
MDSNKRVIVLLIDDDKTQWVLTREYLRHRAVHDYEVRWASTFDEGLEQLRYGHHDIVLLDQVLDSGTGLELLERVPDAAVHFPVIMLTGTSDEELDSLAMQYGLVDYLEKGQLTPILLDRAIRYALHNFQAQRALREGAERFKNLYNAVFEGILVHDGEYILDANAAFLVMTGKAYEQTAGARLMDFCEGDRTWILAREDSACETDLRGENGRTLHVEVRGRRHLYNGRLAHIVAVRDITERKRFEDELRRVNNELDTRVAERTEALNRSNRDLERFAQIVAHDIQLPLRTVAQHMVELRTKESSAQDPETTVRVHFVDRAIQTVERLSELVDGVLKYSRLAMQPIEFSFVDLNGVMDSVLDMLDSEIQGQEARLHIEPLPVVRGNAALLADLFTNLLHNALHYRGPEAPEIHISTEEQHSAWRISVVDNGTGFGVDEAEAIFVVLHRGGNAANRPGHGLGLATCKRIVELHGGHIWAVSEPGRGAMFHLTLPKDKGASAHHTDRSNHREEAARA